MAYLEVIAAFSPSTTKSRSPDTTPICVTPESGFIEIDCDPSAN
jgi:hypothetical protein